MDFYLELLGYGFHPGPGGRKRDGIEFMKNFMLAGGSAALGKTIFAPIERVKLLLQLQQTGIDPSKRYKGAIDCLIRIPKEEGFLGYWRGNFTNVLRYFPTQALSFAFRDVYKKILVTGIDKNTEFNKYCFRNVVSGALAGGTALCFVYPLDFARTRLSLDMGKQHERQYKNLRDCLKKIYKADGIVGLYRGFHMSFHGIIVFRGASFGIYDVGRAVLHPSNDTIWMSILLAQTATVLASFLGYPFDTVSRRMMMQSGFKPEQRRYKNSYDCSVKMIREEGFKSFYKGNLINTFRCTGAAFVLVLYEEVRRLI